MPSRTSRGLARSGSPPAKLFLAVVLPGIESARSGDHDAAELSAFHESWAEAVEPNRCTVPRQLSMATSRPAFDGPARSRPHMPLVDDQTASVEPLPLASARPTTVLA